MSTEPLPTELVSILTPTFNAAATIKETLASAQAQSHVDIEIIVVDDGSRDDTLKIIEAAARQDPRIRLLCQPNAGVAAARNAALAAARGQLIAPLDADDLWHPDKIRRQLRRLWQAGLHAGVVYCWSTDIDWNSRIVQHRLDLDRYDGDVFPALVLTNFLANASVPLIRRADLEAVGGWDTSLRARGAQGCEDWQLYLRLADRCAFALEPAFLVGYRQGRGTMSRDVAQMWRSYRLVLDEARRARPELPGFLFRWSAAAFAFYAFELRWKYGHHLRSLPSFAAGLLRDPIWLARHSSWTKLTWGFQRLLYRAGHGRAEATTTAEPPFPIGRFFHELPPNVEWEVTEGRTVAQRRKLVQSLGRARSGAQQSP
ncbi:glycosyltransferase family 2 protein [Paracraurococcus lichenis]|uniref:Glycosyltransferase family A protein n=1 Tax=Paracraurococcus lichenis TaxID=3064888 RepID=A0ABT9EBI7_9PROT|nr:glycosyltransferase family A protein [Paracraurococcus sp. LOR1-02]MDO9713578.1 glycosyltransferase family A protein [Paracraurococcus sp. LOR1-02]